MSFTFGKIAKEKPEDTFPEGEWDKTDDKPEHKNKRHDTCSFMPCNSHGAALSYRTDPDHRQYAEPDAYSGIFMCIHMRMEMAAAVGFISPFIRYAAFGMPPLMPIGVGMAFEMLTYGLVAGLLYKILPKKTVNIYVSLIISMIAGRVVWGLALIIAGVTSAQFTWEMFISGALLTAVPGIILHIVLIPPHRYRLKRAKLIN